MSATVHEAPRRIGRYALYGAIGSGGMATVHLGRLFGPRGFARIVAIKRLHAVYADDPAFTVRFMQEARLASRIRHPNVVPVLDVLAEGGELSLVMEYVEGESFARLLRIANERGQTVPVPIAAAVVAGILHGLHAAHESEGEDGRPLGVVHRDVSPQNVIVGTDGVARLLDFGVAKAVGLAPATRGGGAVGKLAYMAPEQIRREAVSPRTDVYAASVMLWEAICGRRLFRGVDEADIVEQVLIGLVPPPSKFHPSIDPELEALLLRGLSAKAVTRPDAHEMAVALEPFAALRSSVATWLTTLAGERLAERAALVRTAERADASLAPEVTLPPVAPSVARSRKRPILIASTLGILAVATAAYGLSARARSARPAPPAATAVPAPESSPTPAGGEARPAPTPSAAAAVRSPAAADAGRPSGSSTPSPTRPLAARSAHSVADAAPAAPGRRCESIDPVTGDIHFDRSCP